jgi:hypothetical protein
MGRRARHVPSQLAKPFYTLRGAHHFDILVEYVQAEFIKTLEPRLGALTHTVKKHSDNTLGNHHSQMTQTPCRSQKQLERKDERIVTS